MPRPADGDKPYGERALQLSPECKGRDVWELQLKLIGWGSGSQNDDIGNFMDPVRLTGTFDTTTRDAVLRFQKAHQLPINGIVDSRVFQLIEREPARHPVLLHDLRCPCALGVNDGPILCRCMGYDTATPPQPKPHTDEGKCTGFGKTDRFKDKFLLDDKKLADDTELKTEKLDLYDMEEYVGLDKALLWAVRAVMCRTRTDAAKEETAVQAVRVLSGYSCWHDNYHHTDDIRWHHRRLTFHLGKAIEFIHQGKCTELGADPAAAPCAECKKIRDVALEKCGFQLRWQQPGRISVAEGSKEARPPAAPWSVHLDTVRLHERKGDGSFEYKDHFVKTDEDALKPVYEGKVNTLSFPLVLTPGVDRTSATDVWTALDPALASGADFFRNTETGPGGWFPVGASRMWHGGVHLFAAAGAGVYAIADGEIVGCRAGEEEDKLPHGSRNFVLLKHKADGKWKGEFYSLYMHLDKEAPSDAATVPWRRQLFIKSKKHVEAVAPCPLFVQVEIDGKKRLVAKRGLALGECVAVEGNEVDPKTASPKIDEFAPDNSKVVKVAGVADTYVFTKRENKDVGKLIEANANLAKKFTAQPPDATFGDAIGLERPIKVCVGELIGQVGKAPTDPVLMTHGTFLHCEVFAGSALTVENFKALKVADAPKVVDRKEVIAALVKEKLLPEPPDGVLMESELKDIFAKPPWNTALRSIALEMPSAWSDTMNWKDALKAADCFGFLQDDKRDKLGDDYNKYRWWKDVKADKGALPASETVHHYHPIALILAIAYA